MRLQTLPKLPHSLPELLETLPELSWGLPELPETLTRGAQGPQREPTGVTGNPK